MMPSRVIISYEPIDVSSNKINQQLTNMVYRGEENIARVLGMEASLLPISTTREIKPEHTR